jgi:hypothetical protein
MTEQLHNIIGVVVASVSLGIYIGMRLMTWWYKGFGKEALADTLGLNK